MLMVLNYLKIMKKLALISGINYLNEDIDGAILMDIDLQHPLKIIDKF